MNAFTANLTATLHVFGAKLLARRDEKGQTTAEYVGILVFVALLVLIVIGLNTEVGDTVKEIITGAFDKIKEKLG